MTISSTNRLAGPFLGTGLGATYTFVFKVFQPSDVLVKQTDTQGVITTLALTTDYTVSLNADQDNYPGGGVNLIANGGILPIGYTLVISSQVPQLQGQVITNNGGFYPHVVTDEFDYLTILIQQLQLIAGNALQLPITVTGVSTQLPTPSSNALIGWNIAANALQNVNPTTLATIVAFGTAQADLFSGTGAPGPTSFTLSHNPGALANLDVAIGGATQRPGLDYTWSGSTITFTGSVPSGTNNVLVRYLQALPQGATDSAASTFIQSGTGAVPRVGQDKMRESVSDADFGARGNGTTDDAVALTNAAALGQVVSLGAASYYLSSAVSGYFKSTRAVAPTFTGSAPKNFGLYHPKTGKLFAQNGASISRLGDRIFLGGATDCDGAFPQASNDWVSTFYNSNGYSGYALPGNLAVTTDTTGNSACALLGAAQTSPFTNPNTSAIGGYFLGVADNATYAAYAWGLYVEGQRTNATGGSVYGLEVDVRNTVSSISADPYGQGGGHSTALQIGSGAGVSATGQFDNTAGIYFVDNPKKFNTGIIFGANSLSGSGVALAFGQGHRMVWYSASNTNTSYIVGGVATQNLSTGIAFKDSGANIQDWQGNPILQVVPSATAVANFASISGSSSGGGNVSFQATGSDANIDLFLATKGSGSLRFGTYTTGVVTQAGYITVKDASGTVRRLLVG